MDGKKTPRFCNHTSQISSLFLLLGSCNKRDRRHFLTWLSPNYVSCIKISNNILNAHHYISVHMLSINIITEILLFYINSYSQKFHSCRFLESLQWCACVSGFLYLQHSSGFLFLTIFLHNHSKIYNYTNVCTCLIE